MSEVVDANIHPVFMDAEGFCPRVHEPQRRLGDRARISLIFSMHFLELGHARKEFCELGSLVGGRSSRVLRFRTPMRGSRFRGRRGRRRDVRIDTWWTGKLEWF